MSADWASVNQALGGDLRLLINRDRLALDGTDEHMPTTLWRTPLLGDCGGPGDELEPTHTAKRLLNANFANNPTYEPYFPHASDTKESK